MGGANNRSLISAHFCISAYFLTAETYKRMRLTTRVYGINIQEFNMLHHIRMYQYIMYLGSFPNDYYDIVIIIYTTRKELASLAHSFYTCLKHQLETSAHASDNCTLQIYLGSKVVIYFYTVEKFTIGHVVAQHGWLNYITNARTHMCTSLTDHVNWSIR